MLGHAFRPWGLADWLLPRIPIEDWHVLGTVSTEDRCLSVLSHLNRDAGNLRSARFIEIDDLPFELSERCIERRQVNRESIRAILGTSVTISNFNLLDSALLIKRFVLSLVSECGSNIVVDITSLPKRFFFPIIKILLRSSETKNLIVTYSTPESYLPPEQQLASEPEDWAFLPMFQREEAPPAPKCIRVIVGVGFLPLRLPELLKHDYQDAEISLLLPFPPGAPQSQRNWQFVHEIEKTCPLKSNQQIIRVHAYDTPGCFDHLSEIAFSQPERTVFAPFGPKTHSLAMCLFAEKHNCDVYYTQPKHYHPDYSTGRKIINGKPETYAYALKLDGRLLY